MLLTHYFSYLNMAHSSQYQKKKWQAIVNDVSIKLFMIFVVYKHNNRDKTET